MPRHHCRLEQAEAEKPISRPVGVSDTEWRAHVQRREAVTTNWQRRVDAKKIRDAAATFAVNQEEVSHAGKMNPPGRNL
ncbi:hypothetical protein D1007_53502 [Hordeum vulgare]|nr:hypothetical protein D1007_53502 [Hordeum vulgare]